MITYNQRLKWPSMKPLKAVIDGWFNNPEHMATRPQTDNIDLDIRIGGKQPSPGGIIGECGFFKHGWHFDRRGLYQWSSMAVDGSSWIRPLGVKLPATYREVLATLGDDATTFGQPTRDVIWYGPVLALQNPHDMAIKLNKSRFKSYYDFVEEACKAYGTLLYLKVHPRNKGKELAAFEKIAQRYGSRIGRANHRIFDECAFVVVYNSNIVVDCMVHQRKRNLPIVQMAPGYFYNTGTVIYSPDRFVSPTFSDIGVFTLNIRENLINNLMWNYMIDTRMSAEGWYRTMIGIRRNLRETKRPAVTPDISWAASVFGLLDKGSSIC